MVNRMARLSPISHGPSTGHHGGTLPPYTGGGGDGRGDRGSGDSMPNYGARLRRARQGLAVAIIPILILFISFTVAYVAWRWFPSGDNPGATIRTWRTVRLPWALLLANTLILVISTATIELARRTITRQAALAPVMSIPGISLGNERHFPWLGVTTVLGLLFLSGQAFVWTGLLAHGIHMNSGPASTFVYFVTFMHALHLAGGILALLTANIFAILRRPVETRRIVVDVTSWYWHLMTGLWIYIVVLLAVAT
jgi:cytochrome c oxidase subunit III